MAARAKSLTDRVKVDKPPARPTPTIAAGDLRVLVTALRELGYDVEALLSAVGLADPSLEPDDRVPCESYGAVIAAAQRQRFTPNLSLAVARATPLGAYPLLDYLVATSDSVGAGVKQLARYFSLVGSPLTFAIHEGAQVVRVEFGNATLPFTVEHQAALMAQHLRAETDGRFTAAAVAFQHQPDDLAEFSRVLGCPVDAGTVWNGMLIATEAWRLPLRRRDPVLRQVLEGRADDILARLPSRKGVAADVQRTLMTHMTSGDTRVGTVARGLAMSGRTLQRRLADEGVSYQELLDDARKVTSGRCLMDSALTVGEVAYLVGYSEPAPFHRAFKRWYGMTPEAFRQKNRTA
jgi:AraC-like DNA-binding protein